MSDNGAGIDAGLKESFGGVIDGAINVDKDLKVADFHPVKNAILVEPIQPKEMTEGGIFLPNAWKEKQAAGFVRRVCKLDQEEAAERGTFVFHEGDFVVFHKNGGVDIELEGRKFVILQQFDGQEGDILGYWPADTLNPQPAAK